MGSKPRGLTAAVWLLRAAVCVSLTLASSISVPVLASPGPSAEPQRFAPGETALATRTTVAEEPGGEQTGRSEARQETVRKKKNYEDTDPSALTAFSDELAPHGYWVEHSRYGLVWVPHRHVVGPDFAPYVSSGRWGLTHGGDWIWVSDYPFGWVVFHYGRWAWSTDHGWVWIPGRRYSHAWVAWRVPAGPYPYLGWAPLPPSYVWMDGMAVGLWYTPLTPYVFVHAHYCFSPHLHRHVLRDDYRVAYAARTTHRHHSSGARPRGPSLEEARIPRERAPSRRSAAHPRAVRLARPDTMPSPPPRLETSVGPRRTLQASRPLEGPRRTLAPAKRAEAAEAPAAASSTDTPRRTLARVTRTEGARAPAPDSAARPRSPAPRDTTAKAPASVWRPRPAAPGASPARPTKAEPSRSAAPSRSARAHRAPKPIARSNPTSRPPPSAQPLRRAPATPPSPPQRRAATPRPTRR